MLMVFGHPYLPLVGGMNAQTIGRYVYFARGVQPEFRFKVHEYIHLLQEEGGGSSFGGDYVDQWVFHGQGGLGNKYERIAYLWQGWVENYPMEKGPWHIWKPVRAPMVYR